jgi:hypothetical protein
MFFVCAYSTSISSNISTLINGKVKIMRSIAGESHTVAELNLDVDLPKDTNASTRAGLKATLATVLSKAKIVVDISTKVNNSLTKKTEKRPKLAKTERNELDVALKNLRTEMIAEIKALVAAEATCFLMSKVAFLGTDGRRSNVMTIVK